MNCKFEQKDNKNYLAVATIDEETLAVMIKVYEAFGPVK